MLMYTLRRVALLGEALLPILLLTCRQEAIADGSIKKSSCVCALPAGPHHMASAARQRGRLPCSCASKVTETLQCMDAVLKCHERVGQLHEGQMNSAVEDLLFSVCEHLNGRC